MSPLSPEALTQWFHATETFAKSEREIERIATWRGIDPAVVRYVAEEGLMGSNPYFGSHRDAFLIERPDPSITARACRICF